jgi:hypothetical protein
MAVLTVNTKYISNIGFYLSDMHFLQNAVVPLIWNIIALC